MGARVVSQGGDWRVDMMDLLLRLTEAGVALEDTMPSDCVEGAKIDVSKM
jgi:hypothetical protein